MDYFQLQDEQFSHESLLRNMLQVPQLFEPLALHCLEKLPELAGNDDDDVDGINSDASGGNIAVLLVSQL